MSLRRTSRIAGLIFALVAIATVWGSSGPASGDEQAGRRWRDAPGLTGAQVGMSARMILGPASDDDGSRWR